MKRFLIEEAKRAKKAGLTKRQFIIAEIIKAIIILLTYNFYLYIFIDILEKF